jgi:hypothetical protein
MKNLLLLSFLSVFAITLLSLDNQDTLNTHHNPSDSLQDSLEQDRKKHVAAVLKSVGDNRGAIADSVFEDIQMLKGMPVGRLLAIMEFGYSKSLGVSCGHCHDVNNFALSDKPQKEIAREMSKFTRKINLELLKNIKHISADATVNCTTCHRGNIKPALNMP